jgi:uncharacterized protein
MSGADILLIGAAAFLAGAMNALAGGGTFFSFPALLAVGVPPVSANASNSVALWPASISGALAYRRELSRHKRYLAPLSAIALAGGLAGGLLLLVTRDATFARLVPWLLLIATLLFAFSGQVQTMLARLRGDGAMESVRNTPASLLVQLAVSVYGGFFGAGMGILMVATLAIQGHADVQDINAIKNWLSALIYSVAVVTFVTAGAVSWPHTAVMLATATAGGYAGAVLARRIPQLWLRRFIIAVGAVLTLYYFRKTL